MTTTAFTATTTVPAGTDTVEGLLDAICAGRGVPAELFAPDVVLDATIPGWRMKVRGADKLARQFSGWFADPATFEELERLPVAGGEVLCYLLTWLELGVPHAAHHCHVLRLGPDGRIAADMFFCGGRWDAGLLAEMAAASDAG
jgi:hypothetical protein